MFESEVLEWGEKCGEVGVSLKRKLKYIQAIWKHLLILRQEAFMSMTLTERPLKCLYI